MQGALDRFRASLDRVRAIHQLYVTLSATVTAILDISDLLRAEVVLIVSALDYFVHEIARLGMLEVWDGGRPATTAYEKFPLPLGMTRQLLTGGTARGILEAEIRSAHGWRSFQRPDAIADAVRLFSVVELWKAVGLELASDHKALKSRLELIVDRRNKIAHEADLDPSFPGQRWAIDRSDAEDALEFVQLIGEAIAKVI